MQHYKNWTKIKDEMKSAKEWLDNKVKIDSQDHKPYTLKVLLSPNSIQYCGQYSAGATNYHSPDKEFILYLERAIKKNFSKITEDATGLMQIDVDEKALAAKAEIQGALDEISEIEKIA